MNVEGLEIGIIGLGYVGLPLALEFGKKFNVVGFDLNRQRIKELKNGFDRTKECTSEDIGLAKKITFSSSITELQKCDFILFVPIINKSYE